MCLTGTPYQMHKAWSKKNRNKGFNKLKMNVFLSSFKDTYLTFTTGYLLCITSCHRIFVEGNLGITKYKSTKINSTKTRMSVLVFVVFPGPSTGIIICNLHYLL